MSSLQDGQTALHAAAYVDNTDALWSIGTSGKDIEKLLTAKNGVGRLCACVCMCVGVCVTARGGGGGVGYGTPQTTHHKTLQKKEVEEVRKGG